MSLGKKASIIEDTGRRKEKGRYSLRKLIKCGNGKSLKGTLVAPRLFFYFFIFFFSATKRSLFLENFLKHCYYYSPYFFLSSTQCKDLIIRIKCARVASHALKNIKIHKRRVKVGSQALNLFNSLRHCATVHFLFSYFQLFFQLYFLSTFQPPAVPVCAVIIMNINGGAFAFFSPPRKCTKEHFLLVTYLMYQICWNVSFKKRRRKNL